MLSNAHFLAKFRSNTAENEPAKKLQEFANYFPNFANPKPPDDRLRTRGRKGCASAACEVLQIDDAGPGDDPDGHKHTLFHGRSVSGRAAHGKPSAADS